MNYNLTIFWSYSVGIILNTRKDCKPFAKSTWSQNIIAELIVCNGT